MTSRWDEFRNPDQDFIVSQFSTPSEVIVAPPLLPTATNWSPHLIEKKVLQSELGVRWKETTPQSAQIVQGVAKQVPSNVTVARAESLENSSGVKGSNDRQRQGRKSSTLYSGGSKGVQPDSMASVSSAAEMQLRFVDPAGVNVSSSSEDKDVFLEDVKVEDGSMEPVEDVGGTFLTDIGNNQPEQPKAPLPIISMESTVSSVPALQSAIPPIPVLGKKVVDLANLESSTRQLLDAHKEVLQRGLATLSRGCSLISALEQVYGVSHCLLAHALVLEGPPPCPYIPQPSSVPSTNITAALLTRAENRGIKNQRLLGACLNTPQAQLLQADGFVLMQAMIFPKPSRSSTVDSTQDITLAKLRNAFPYVDDKYPVVRAGDHSSAYTMQPLPAFPLNKNQQPALSLNAINTMFHSNIATDLHALFATLQPRMSTAFCSFFLSLNTETRDSLLPYFADLLAQHTFLALAHAFPHSVHQLNTDVAKVTISNFFSHCINGVRSLLSPANWLVPFTAKNAAYTDRVHDDGSQTGNAAFNLLTRLKIGTQPLESDHSLYNEYKDALPTRVLDRLLGNSYLYSDHAIQLLIGNIHSDTNSETPIHTSTSEYQVYAVAPPSQHRPYAQQSSRYISKSQFQGHSIFVWMFLKLHSPVTPNNQDGVSTAKRNLQASTHLIVHPAVASLERLSEQEQLHNTRRHGSLSKSLNLLSLQPTTSKHQSKRNAVDIIRHLKSCLHLGQDAINKQTVETKDARQVYKVNLAKELREQVEGKRLQIEFSRKLATLKRAAKSRRVETVAGILKQRQAQKLRTVAEKQRLAGQPVTNTAHTTTPDEEPPRSVWGSTDGKHQKNADTLSKATGHTASLLSNLSLQTRHDVTADDDLVIMRRVTVKASELRVNEKSTLAKYSKKSK